MACQSTVDPDDNALTRSKWVGGGYGEVGWAADVDVMFTMEIVSTTPRSLECGVLLPL